MHSFCVPFCIFLLTILLTTLRTIRLVILLVVVLTFLFAILFTTILQTIPCSNVCRSSRIPVQRCFDSTDSVGVCVGTERYAEECSRFVSEECVLIGIFIHVSRLSGFSGFPGLPPATLRHHRGWSIPNIPSLWRRWKYLEEKKSLMGTPLYRRSLRDFHPLKNLVRILNPDS